MATHSSVLALENPRDGGAWWAAVYGVAQSRTRLKRLSSSSSSSIHELYSHVFILSIKLITVAILKLLESLFIYRFLLESKFVLLASGQARKLKEEMLGQRIVTLFGKSADPEDGGLVSQRIISLKLELRLLSELMVARGGMGRRDS